MTEIHGVEGLSEGQRQSETLYRESIAAHSAKLATLAELKAAIGDNARTVSAVELRGRRDAVDELELEATQDAVDLAARRRDLLVSRKPELTAHLAKCEGDRDKAFSTAEKALQRAGVTVETVTASPNGPPIAATNGDAAANVFANRVRESAPWRDANAAAVNALAAVDTNGADIRAAELGVVKAEKQLAAVVASIVGVPQPTSNPAVLPMHAA